MRRALALSFLLAVAAASSGHADSKEELARTKKEMQAAKERQQSIEREARALESELFTLQQDLVQAAARVQKGERDLSAAEETLRVMDRRLAEKNAALEERRKHLAGLVQAALNLSRTPPEAVVLMPGDSEKTMKAARALKMTSASIKAESEAIGRELAELEALRVKVAAQRDTLARRQKELAQQQKALSRRLAERRNLQEKLNAQARSEAEKIARLARQAEDLQGLMATLQKERVRGGGRVLEMPDYVPQGKRGKVRSFLAAKGKIRPPLAGRIIQAYGSESRKNETHRGITILARPGAQVVAPYDGEVVYAGSFLNYGRMVIIHHSDNFHTLLAGLAEIDVRAGEFLLEGEPIGAMGEGESKARLYVELRKKNQPIDPAPWIVN